MFEFDLASTVFFNILQPTCVGSGACALGVVLASDFVHQNPDYEVKTVFRRPVSEHYSLDFCLTIESYMHLYCPQVSSVLQCFLLLFVLLLQ